MLLQLVVSGLLLGGIYALIAVGLSLIFGVMHIVNFAHGEYVMLGMYATFWLFNGFGVDPYVSILFIIPLFFVIGVATHRLVIQPLLNAPPVTQIFATVGLSLALQNAALFLWKSDYRTVVTEYSYRSLFLGDVIVSWPRLIAFAIAMLVILGLYLFLRYTYPGKSIRAVVQERRAAQLVGVNMLKAYRLTFGIGITCVGVAGAVLVPMFYVFPTVGSFFVLIAFVITVLGGMGNLLGALVGGLLVGTIEVVSGFYLSPHLKEAVYFAVFILVLLVRPTGLFGHARS